MTAGAKDSDPTLLDSAANVYAALASDDDTAAGDRARTLAGLVDGELEADEQSQLEQDVAQSPFLLDAAKELEELRTEIHSSQARRRRLAFPLVSWRSYLPLAAAAGILALLLGGFHALGLRPSRARSAQLAAGNPDSTPRQLEAIFSSDFENRELPGWAVETGDSQAGNR